MIELIEKKNKELVKNSVPYKTEGDLLEIKNVIEVM
jgi:hypothetical protein